MAQERISTGISGLDEVLCGGLIKNRSYLIVGGPGTGKTIMSIHWLLDGNKHDEQGLFISLGERPDKMKRNMECFGWDLNGIEFIDLTLLAGPEIPEGEYHIFHKNEVEFVSYWDTIYKIIEEKSPRRVVIDPMTQLLVLAADEYQFRKHVLKLLNILADNKITSFLTFEPSELERDNSLALLVDGVIRVRSEVSTGRVINIRSLQVEKLRGTDFMGGLHPFRITEDGIKVFPHRIERPTGTTPGSEKLQSGIPQLDELLGGGLDSGTTTIITGPSGVGKSTLGLHFLSHCISQGKRAFLFTFEESVESIKVRAHCLNISINRQIETGNLKIIRVNPMECYPDEFLMLTREAVKQYGAQIIMIDSLRGYQLAMEQFGMLTAHMQNLITFLNSQNVSTMLINEIENITGDLRFTEIGISYLADNIILLRFAELTGDIKRILCCFKRRLGDYRPELHAFSITSSGITIGDKLGSIQGVLTGTPEIIDNSSQ